MIELRHLTKTYGAFHAVNDVSLDVPRGQVLGLLGPNGAGKTTTIRMLTGYLPPTSGFARVDGFDSLTQSADVRRRLGYLPESNALYTEMTVLEYLRFRGRLFDLRGSALNSAVERVVERCWLDQMRKRLIGRLSKGFRQRVGLAAAMLHSPPVLVLDEPTSGLDPVQIRETRTLIRELAGSHTMILSSHILPEVERTCDRVVIIAQGRIRADGTVADLRRQAGQVGRYVVEVEATSSDGLSSRLRSIAGVREIGEEQESNGWRRLTITAADDAADLREALGRSVRESGALCRELSRESASLEQLFVRITAGASAEIGSSLSPSAGNSRGRSESSLSAAPVASGKEGS